MFKIMDIVVYGIIIIIITMIIYFALKDGNKKPDSFEVFINGKITYRYIITKERKEYIIDAPAGKEIIVCEDNKVWKKEASCKNKICEKEGKISKSGETLICIPNKEVIKISGQSYYDYILK